ncbi:MULTISPECIES: DUF6894 family protein [unclassified Aureimonas]|uniref:DUF6894 family protein n=1 Tax=unclassified Aureimonas TaxID=2615206 RepID=UPI0006F9A4F8|nr:MULTISPECIES: hypothetical protein [unclassified Aureimonas]KQT58550.1 hypothetical protein ASG62_24545 [Aureimonas sp. Leaf427]KQT64572.1 hypothetical protein ASG54_22785 [Aureimonas sp. Leaf460]
MLYRFRYLDGDRIVDDPTDTFEYPDDKAAILASDDGIRCMISDRIRQRAPMYPGSIVEVADISGRVVHRLSIADLLDEAMHDDRS